MRGDLLNMGMGVGACPREEERCYMEEKRCVFLLCEGVRAVKSSGNELYG